MRCTAIIHYETSFQNYEKKAGRAMDRDLTRGPVMRTMLLFAVPMILGNLLQQCYNVADTLIVGRFLGADALAAVGSAFTLMNFLTSILLGLSLGSGTVFSICFGQRDQARLRESVYASFALLAAVTVALNVLVFALTEQILDFLRVTGTVRELLREYLVVIFAGLPAIFLYNYFAAMLRSVGNSTAPLVFLAVSAGMNIGLDLWFVLGLKRGVAGAAEATVISQYVSGVGIAVYALKNFPGLRVKGERVRLRLARVREIASFSALTCVQQSIMNFGILTVQGLVNSFGTTVMAAFAVAVKIDTLAYMPVQDFGNAFSTFVAQNFGAQKRARIRSGTRWAVFWVVVFCLVLGGLVCLLAPQLMAVFVGAEAVDVIAVGTGYLRIEGAFYLGIGILFLLYGYFRAVNRPAVSVVLTVCSLGTRVALAYALSALPALGVTGIWMAIPIGWFFADLVGILLWRREDRQSR